MMAIEHSRAVQMAISVVEAEKPSAMIRATDMRIAIPPRPKMAIRPQSCRRET